MIILITYEEKDKKTGKTTGINLVSHGINSSTMENIILPNVPPVALGGKFNDSLGEWVLI